MAEPWKKYQQGALQQQPVSPYVVQGPAREPAPRYADEAAKNAAEADLARGRVSMLPAEQGKAQAEAALAQARVGEIGQTDDAVKLKQKRATLNSLVNQINRVEHLYRQTIEPTSGLGGFLDFLPTEANRQFDTAGNILVDQGLAAFRTPGQGSQSNLEAEQFWAANRPRASKYDSSIEEQLRAMRGRVDETRQELGLPPAKWQASEDAVEPPSRGMTRSPERMIPSGGEEAQTFAQGAYRSGDDPALAGVNARINKMLKDGAPLGAVAKYMQSVGIPAREVQQILYSRPRGQEMSPAQFRRKYPNYRGDWKIDVDNVQIPMSGLRQTINNVAQTPGGAYAASAADALSLGTLDNMTSNPELARAGMAGLREQNPLSSLAGTVTGGAMAAGAGELGAARLGLQGVRGAMAGDALYGAGYGAGSADDGSRALGALQGAGLGVAGGVIGRKVTSAGGRALTGTRDAATRYLTERGVPLTIGQIAGRGGVVGRSVKRIEDALESVPILGAAIRARRSEGTQAFNAAAFKEALEPIPPTTVSTIAEEGIEQARGAVSSAYDSALSGVHVAADKTFVRDMRRAMAAGQRLHPEVAEDFNNIIQNQIAPELANGRLTGEGYQALRQAIRQERAVWKGRPRGHQYGQALRQVEGALENLVRRRSVGTVDSLNRADRAYGRTKILEDAVGRGINAETGGVFTPAQLGMAARASGKRYGNSGSTTDRPFFELQRAGQEILPSRLANSGTADRAISAALLPALPGLTGAAGASTGIISPETAGIMAALGLPFTATGQAAFQRLLVQRPELVRSIGQQVLARKGAGGLFGAGAGASLAAQ